MNILNKSWRHVLARNLSFVIVFALTAAGSHHVAAQEKFEFRGRVIDEDTGKLIYSRVYLRDAKGMHYHVEPASDQGIAIPYRVERGESKEVHTTLSNHVFKVDLSPGQYRLTVEHGKEYLSKSIDLSISDSPLQKTIPLKRWSNVGAKHWYSGEVHIHRKVDEMPVVMLAEDLNVTLPLTYWVTDTDAIPATHNKADEKPFPAKLIEVSKDHVIWPINTEYEIFSVKKKRHTLGAFFVLGHKEPLELKTPPLAPIVKQARAQNALIDMDKHNWPWSMMIVPQMKVDLFELTNNHIWRTKFLFKDWYANFAPEYMNLEMDKHGAFTAKSWLDFGLQNYYALLNCGIRISPSAGTASGVHPVPAGFGRVYVHLPNGFSYDSWMKGLKKGNSFVTNGPMLTATVNGNIAGREFDLTKNQQYKIVASASYPTDGNIDLQIVVNGEVIDSEKVQVKKALDGVTRVSLDSDMKITESSWLCVRCLQEQPNGNISFAHSAPFYFTNGTKPVRPRRAEIEYLISRVAVEIRRNQSLLDKDQLAEYESALKFYRAKLKTAR